MIAWDQIQQLIRIVAQLIAGYLIGTGVFDEGIAEEFVGGIISIAAVVWWVVWERRRTSASDA